MTLLAESPALALYVADATRERRFVGGDLAEVSVTGTLARLKHGIRGSAEVLRGQAELPLFAPIAALASV